MVVLPIILALLALLVGPVCAERLLPPAPLAERELVVVDWDPRSAGDRTDDLSVRSLQGLVNRRNPSIWVGTEPGKAGAGWWLARYGQMGLVAKSPKTISKDEFLSRYKGYAKGVVIPPENLGREGYRVAVMKAAADGLIVGSRELAAKLGLKVVEDYSNRFRTYAQSWRYALDVLWPKLSHRALFVDRDDLVRSTATVDYAVQQKLFLCAPHAGRPEEMKLFHEVLSRLALNSPVLGSAGGGGMCSEGDVVRAVSKWGKVFVGCSTVPNLTIHAGISPRAKLVQPMRQCPKLDRSKAYVAIEISDGDNANVHFSHIPKKGLWEARGRVPLGWTIGQGTFELAPALIGYYQKTRTPLDEFITGVSGHAYIFPGDFGNALSAAAKEKAWRTYLRRTEDFLSFADMRVVTMLQYQEAPGVIGREVFARYARSLKHATGIINGYNAVSSEYGRTWDIVEGMPVFYTVTDRTWSNPGDETLYDAVVKNTPKERPAFLVLFMVPFALSPDHFQQVVHSLDKLKADGYELVLPSELASLARQTREPANGTSPVSDRIPLGEMPDGDFISAADVRPS